MAVKNIFEVGSVVSGDSFIGRKDLLREYQQMIFSNAKCPNISIVGVPRIGKTSFVKKVLEKERKNYINIYIDLGKLKVFKDLWVVITQKIIEYFNNHNINASELENNLEKLENTNNYILINSIVESIFSFLYKKELNVVVAIDEFDSARDVFAGEASYFEMCREIFSNTKNITPILISRKMLKTIVEETPGSTFDGIFNNRPFKGFNEDDMNEYWNVFEKKNIQLTEQQKENIVFYAGNIPLLLSLIAYNILNKYNLGKSIDIDDIVKDNFEQINRYYNNIITHLDRDKLKEKLISIILGPNFRITRQDKSNLINLGYLTEDGKGYISFSRYFEEFLKIEELNGNQIWPELQGMEKILKQIIREELKINDISQQLDLIKTVASLKEIQMLDKFIKDTKKNHGITADYIDVMSLGLSIRIIESKWIKDFSKYFDYDDLDKWTNKFSACSRARNPLAHGHEEYLSEQEVIQVTSFSKEIKDKVFQYLSQNGSSNKELKNDTKKTNTTDKKISPIIANSNTSKNRISDVQPSQGNQVKYNNSISLFETGEIVIKGTNKFVKTNKEQFFVHPSSCDCYAELENGVKVSFNKKSFTNDKGDSKLFAVDIKVLSKEVTSIASTERAKVKFYSFTGIELGKNKNPNIKGILAPHPDLQGILKGSISQERLVNKGLSAFDVLNKKLNVTLIELNPQRNGWILDVYSSESEMYGRNTNDNNISSNIEITVEKERDNGLIQ